jgi:putative polysaccharide biosynthesis protein
MSLTDGTQEIATQRLNIAECMAFASRHAGKSFVSMVREIFSLGRGFGKLTPEDYFYFRLYDDKKYDFAAKQRFMSDKRHTYVANKCNDVKWWAMADDKLIANIILKGYPLPDLEAVFSARPRNGGVSVMHSAQELEHFLMNGARYPLFAKPIYGVQSRGAWSIDAADKPARAVITHDGAKPVAEFAAMIAGSPGDGYLFQRRLDLHPDLAVLCGNNLSTVRLVLIQPDKAPEIIHALWKLRTSDNVADNFWRPGNMLAQLDIESGRILRVVQGVGPSQVELENHPETGKRLLGAVMPDWAKMKAIALECSQIFPKLRYITWDIAPTPDGPIIVEVNPGGAFTLPQVAEGQGILDDKFRAFLRYCKA